MKLFYLLFIFCVFTITVVGQQHVETNTWTHTFTTHSSVIELTVEAIGGGGRGGRVSGNLFSGSSRAGGGGGGAYAKGKVLVNPSTNYSFRVGAGGPNSGNDNPTNGEDSWFNSATSTDNTTTVRARGGTSRNGTGQTAGAAGGNNASPNSIWNISGYSGGNGGSSTNNDRGGGGGGGAGSGGNGASGGTGCNCNNGGAGGTGALLSNHTAGTGGIGGVSDGNDTGLPGNDYGAGGGGSRKSGGNNTRNGREGANGIVVISWSRIDDIPTVCAGGTTTITGFNFQTTMPNGTAVTTTSVSLNGTSLAAGQYTVNSNTQITINVPAGATSGYVVVTTTLGRAQFYLNVSGSSSTAPTSVSGGGDYCWGNNINLTSTGGANGTNVAHVWYKGGCNNAFTETWSTQSYGTVTTTVNSNNNGILSVTSMDGDPMINMFGLGSFAPATYRYMNIRYRVVSGAAGNVEIFFLNTAYPSPNGACHTSESLISDAQWHIATLDLHQNPNYTIGGNITGWRYDWCTANGVTMELDFIQLSQYPMIDENNTTPLLEWTPAHPHYPTSGTITYAAAKIDACGIVTTCASTTVTLPTPNTLGTNGESAYCNVNAGETVHFFERTSGNYIASVTAGANNLGRVDATVFVKGAPMYVDACTSPGNTLYATHILQRHWTIIPTNNHAATVRLPYTMGELATLSPLANSNPNPDDNVGGAGDLQLSKYSGSSINNTPYDNCPVGNTTIHAPATSGNIGYLTGFSTYLHSQFSIPGFSEFYLHGGPTTTPLSVKLSDYSATCENSANRIAWQTEDEQNTSHFVVERSRDGYNWSEIARIESNGTKNISNKYEITEDTNEETYYQLKSIDYDGKTEIIGIKHLKCKTSIENNLVAYPNPSNGNFTVEIHSDESKDGIIQLYDLTGKVISNLPIIINKGINSIYFNEYLRKGVYVLNIQTEGYQFKPTQIIIK